MPRAAGKIEPSNSDGQVEAARACAAWVYVEDAVFFVLRWLVGVAEQNDVNVRGGWLYVQVGDVVNEVEIGGRGFNKFGFLQS